MAKKTNDEDGVWRTIKGRHIFIKNGQSLEEAMAESGKFEGKTKTDVKKDNNKVKDDELKKEDKEDKEDKKDKDKDKAKEEPTNDLKSQVDELLGKSHTKIPNDVLGSVDDIYDDYLANQKGDKFYAIEGDKILTFDTDVNGSERYWEEEFPISDYEDANKWLNGEVEYSDYLESKKDSQESQPKTESNASGDVTSDDLDDYVNFKIEGPDGKPQYVSASWSWNDLDEEDIPDGESLEDWRGINYNIYDENGEEVDGGMLITDQDSFKAEDLCKDLIELNGYSRDNKIERLDNGDIEDVMQSSDSGKSTEDPYDDPESEESQRLQSIQSRYDDYLQKTTGEGISYGEIAYVQGLRGKQLDDFEHELDKFEDYYENRKNQAPKKSNEEWTKDEKERLDIARDIAKELYQLNENNSTQEKIDKYARDIMEYRNGEVISNENPYTDKNGNIQRSTQSLKDWRDSLKQNQSTNDREFKASMGEVDIPDDFVAQFNDYVKKQSENKSTNDTMNDAIRQKTGKNATNNIDPYEIYEKGMQVVETTDDYKLKDRINNTLDKIDRANKRGEGYSQKATNELKNILSEIGVYDDNDNKPTNEKNYRKIEKQLLDDYTKVDTDDLKMYRDIFKEQGKNKFAERLDNEISKRENQPTNETMNNAIREKATKGDETLKEVLKKANENAKNISDDKKLEFQRLKQNYIENPNEENWKKFTNYEKENNMQDYTISEDYNKDDVKSLEDRINKNNKSTNETMNNAIRQKANKTKQVEPDLPKATEIKTQGKSNRKEVSENIQAHILDYYDSPDDFVEQMDVFNYLPNNWKRGEEIAKGGSYLVYNGDMADFLDSLKINPKGKKFSEDKAFDMYTSLIGRESAKLYDRIKKNQYNQYKKDHPLTKMTFEDFKNQNKK